MDFILSIYYFQLIECSRAKTWFVLVTVRMRLYFCVRNFFVSVSNVFENNGIFDGK